MTTDNILKVNMKDKDNVHVEYSVTPSTKIGMLKSSFSNHIGVPVSDLRYAISTFIGSGSLLKTFSLLCLGFYWMVSLSLMVIPKKLLRLTMMM